MKKTAKIYAAGLLTGIFLFGSTMVLANTGGVMRELIFGVNVVVDGVPQHFAYDMRPFITEGRTFLPVSGIADALGVEVSWEGNTNTVYLWSDTHFAQLPPQAPQVNYTWFDQMGHTNYNASGPDNYFVAWLPTRVTTAGDTFDRGFLLRLGNWHGGPSGFSVDTTNLAGAVSRPDTDEPWVSFQSMDFMLNAGYKAFIGTIVCAESNRARDNVQGAQVRFYGDGHLIYTSPVISAGTRTVDFEIDVTGVSILRMEVNIPNVQTGNMNNSIHNSDSTYVGIVNARFKRN
ncbi:MAG: stalk domain-containing protein [Defluviitaleaceae bacterium]|nr:stalk domain-containing protein [Defluviitaleaceae bacterium]